MDRVKPKRRGKTFLVERVGGLFRVARQTKRRNESRERFFIGLMLVAERIDMTGRDSEQTGDTAESVEPAHRVSLAIGIR